VDATARLPCGLLAADMNILIAPDKFKGTLDASQVCEAIEVGLIRSGGGYHIKKLPLADGGEGSLQVITGNHQARIVEVAVHDPLMRIITAPYALLVDGRTAFIEMARASGLQLLKPHERNPLKTTSYGTGELIRDALQQGATQIIIGIGGSATNDAALGAFCALGGRLTSRNGKEVFPSGENLHRIFAIEDDALNARLAEAELIALCDVTNPFYGPQGAAQVYAPQKGATPQAVALLDEGLKHLALLIRSLYHIDLQQVSGAGAGGGFAGGAYALLRAQLKSGAAVMLEVSGFKEAVQWADVIITGEGKLDKQTLNGKLVQLVVEQARSAGKPVWIVCGVNELTAAEANALQPAKVLSLSEAFGRTQALVNTRQALEILVERTMHVEGK